MHCVFDLSAMGVFVVESCYLYGEMSIFHSIAVVCSHSDSNVSPPPRASPRTKQHVPRP